MKSLIYLLHGFIFAFGSSVILYGSVVGVNIFVPPTDVINPIIFSIVAFALFVLVGYFLTRSLETAGLIATFLVLGFFYLWSIFLMIGFAALVGLLLIKIILKRAESTDTHLVLNAISVAVVGYYLFNFIF